MQHFDSLPDAARTLPVGALEDFTAMHCDPLYNAGEQWEPRLFRVVRNDVSSLVVRRQYRNADIDLSEYREGLA